MPHGAKTPSRNGEEIPDCGHGEKTPDCGKRGRTRNNDKKHPRIAGKRLRPALAGLVALSLLAGLACRAPRPESAPFWDQRDDANPERIDHARWQAILDAHVTPDETGVNLVDYAALQANAADRERLTAYLDDLQAIDPRRLAADEQMAYWINLYNALTVQVVLGDYPVDSIREIHEGVIPLVGPWGDVRASVAGQPLTLDDIEHRILRPIWQDARIHYAVNCAAYGCPQSPGAGLHPATTWRSCWSRARTTS